MSETTNKLYQWLGAKEDEVVELCSSNDFHYVEPKRFSSVFCNRSRGVVGIEITLGKEMVRYSPTHMIATNLSFERVLEKFLTDQRISSWKFAKQGVLRAFSAEQFLFWGNNFSKSIKLVRGSTIVDESHTTSRGHAIALIDGIEQWMVLNQSAEGRIPYKYWPSRGTESPADNAIRNFLACWALARLAKTRKNAKLGAVAQQNLKFNIIKYFRSIGNGHGAIVESTGAKLGAAAVAGLAILEAPNGQEFREELMMLVKGINSMEDNEHGFRTFFFPEERDGENWNFYSGEALLFLSEAARHELPFAPTLRQCTKIFELCRAKHYTKRNPAFVPWHSQACVSLFSQTGLKVFADFVFEINDWLLSMQQWDGLPPELKGRFYNPQRPDFGPPHAASTGAYVEGLAEGIALANYLGDQSRASSYEIAVLRGLRSLRQLQFRDTWDAFYISKRNRVMGALRTEVYDNAIRIDSAAHALLAAIKILNSVKSNLRPS